METCVFCDIVAGDGAAHVIDEDEDTVAFLDHAPFTRGHTLVVPRAHHRDLWEVDTETLLAVMRMAHRVAGRIRESLEPDGCNLLQSTGLAAFQTVFHLHVHVIPRWDDDRMSIPDWPKEQADGAELADVAARLRSG